MPTFPHHRNNLPGPRCCYTRTTPSSRPAPSLPAPSAPPPQQSFGAHFGSSGGLQQPLAPTMGELLHSLKK